MEKKCFVIMPISDCDDYAIGHFKRVYEYIIKPACIRAGFKPLRADDVMTTNYIALDIIKNIIQCEMSLCDLSSRNPNVLYELGIRQAFNLPVTLLKDNKTSRIFDIQGFRDVEYDENLRIDTVETTILDLSEVIKNTYENKQSEINSLISLLGIEPAKLSEKTKISKDTELILNSISLVDHRLRFLENTTTLNTRQIVQNYPQYPENVGSRLQLSDFDTLQEGISLFHHRFGEVVIDNIRKKGQNYFVTFV
ncbi:MAG: hypothetical protein IPQ02_08370 [Saprospiraceae bacterium]|nr:hypothetical protein [Candidatus Defluviibacterium haderslevense]